MATSKVIGTKPKTATKTEVKEEVVTPEVKKIEEVKPKRVEVNRHDMVRVTNCTDSNVYFTSYSGFLIELPAGGTSMNITVEQLQEIANKARTAMQRYEIVPVEVISGDCELQDVYNYVGIANLDIIPDPNYLRDLILNTSAEDIEALLSVKKQEFKEAVVTMAVNLFNEGYLNDFMKMNYFIKLTGNSLLFDK